MGGVIGVARERFIACFFSDYNDKLAPHRNSMAVLRAVKASIGLVTSNILPVYALADHDGGADLLERLGFTHLEGELFRWAG